MRALVSLRHFFRVAAHAFMLPALESGEEILVGGQAVMEGVMMRAPHSYCVAVRKSGGEIVTTEMPLARMSEQYPIYKLPIFRGIGTLYQAMKLGVKALQFSANVALADQGNPAPEQAAKEPSKWVMAASLLFPLAFFIFMYKFVPLYAVTRLARFYPVLGGRLAFNTADGLIRIAIFLAFLYLISRWGDMRRVW